MPQQVYEIDIDKYTSAERQDAANAYADKYGVDAAGILSNTHSTRCALYEWQFKTNKNRYMNLLRKKRSVASASPAGEKGQP